jgi:cell division control protein 45
MVRHDVNQETGNPRALTEALRLIRERSVTPGFYALADLNAVADDSVDNDSLLILAAREADGVCSAHILTAILKQEFIRYTLQSVDTYSDLEQALSNLRSTVRTVVLLNCGAVVDLTVHLENLEDVILIVIDSHRPINLKNVKEPSRILVLDDDLGRGGYFPLEAMEEQDDDEIIEDLFLDDDDEYGNPKRQRTSEEGAGGLDRETRKRMLREYYEGYYYGSPTSLVLYTMASDVGYQTQQLLWLACVGLASYLETGYFSLDTFRTIAQEVDNHFLSQISGPTDENQPDNPSITSTQGTNNGLRFTEDLRLVMYRHWSLFQAMWHSPYVYSKLELHRDHGHGTMQKLLMFAGISPDNYNQTYSSMSHSSRKLVGSDKFKRKCAAFGMDEIKFYQFIRSVRMKDEEKPSLMLNEVTASDVYYMLTTALHLKDFNFAMDVAVNQAPLAQMHECISRSLDVHKDICIQAKLILDKRAWRLVDGFRFSVIEKPISSVFQHSSHAIRWLAMFLMTVLQSRKQSTAPMPLLLCVKRSEGASYICLGADPQDTKSEFVFRFRNACEATAVKIQLNSFDFALAEVPSADFETWTHALLGGDQMGGDDDDYESDASGNEEEQGGVDEDQIDQGDDDQEY